MSELQFTLVTAPFQRRVGVSDNTTGIILGFAACFLNSHGFYHALVRIADNCSFYVGVFRVVSSNSSGNTCKARLMGAHGTLIARGAGSIAALDIHGSFIHTTLKVIENGSNHTCDCRTGGSFGIIAR